MAAIRQVKQGIAKALQLASDNQAFQELPECSILSTLDVISIKLENYQRVEEGVGRVVTGGTDFEDITFLVRNEKAHKATVLRAILKPAHGFVVQTTGGKGVMDVKLTVREGFLGKILHPHQATVYKVVDHLPAPIGHNYTMVRVDQPDVPYMLIEKVPFSIYPVLKLVGLAGAECVYWFKRPDGTILGYLRPKAVRKDHTLIVKFSETCTDPQARAAIVGCALLFSIHKAYPVLKSLLKHTTNDD